MSEARRAGAARPAGGDPLLVVVGGGITGLAAAWEARDRARVVILEGAATLGGKIADGTVGGVRVADGPDAFLARVPWATDLCREAGLADELVSPATGSAYVWSRGALRRFPDGLMLGVPTDLVAVARSGIVGPLGLARAALDLVRPATPPAGDESVAEVVGRRLGRPVVDRLVAPLLGGINAGDVDHLSLQAVAPQVWEAAERHRSLLLGLRSARSPAAGPSAGPVFLSPRDGLAQLVARVEERLVEAGVEIRTATPVAGVESGREGPEVVTVRGDRIPADGVVVTAPAPRAAELVRAASPAAAAELDAIRHASVALVQLAYPRSATDHPLDAAGMLVPEVEGRAVTAATFWGSKWPHAAQPGRLVLRISVGRFGDDRAETLDDPELVRAVRTDLADLLGVRGEPDDVRIVRWPRSFPQYEPEHLARVDRIEERVARDLPGVAVAGAPYRGVGIPACIRSGRDAAATLLDTIGNPQG